MAADEKAGTNVVRTHAASDYNVNHVGSTAKGTNMDCSDMDFSVLVLRNHFKFDNFLFSSEKQRTLLDDIVANVAEAELPPSRNCPGSLPSEA